MLKETIKGGCTPTVVVCTDSFFPTPLPLKNMKIPENTEKDSSGEGDVQMKYSWLVMQPRFRNSNKNSYLYECRSL
jgi:hypothetical protein